LRREGERQWDGFLSRDRKWLETAVKTEAGDLARDFGR